MRQIEENLFRYVGLFSGNPDENFEHFIEKFDIFCKNFNLAGDFKLRWLPLLLKNRAFNIYVSIPAEEKWNYAKIVEYLKVNFGITHLPRHFEFEKAINTSQQSLSVQEFFELLLANVRNLNLSDELKKSLFLLGLRKPIRKYVELNQPVEASLSTCLLLAKQKELLGDSEEDILFANFEQLKAKIEAFSSLPSEKSSHIKYGPSSQYHRKKFEPQKTKNYKSRYGQQNFDVLNQKLSQHSAMRHQSYAPLNKHNQNGCAMMNGNFQSSISRSKCYSFDPNKYASNDSKLLRQNRQFYTKVDSPRMKIYADSTLRYANQLALSASVTCVSGAEIGHLCNIVNRDNHCNEVLLVAGTNDIHRQKSLKEFVFTISKMAQKLRNLATKKKITLILPHCNSATSERHNICMEHCLKLEISK